MSFTCCSVVFFGVVIAVSSAQSDGSGNPTSSDGSDHPSDDPTSSNDFVVDEVGISVFTLAGFIILVLLIGWLWFCWKVCHMQYRHQTKMRKEDKQYRQRLAMAQHRIREQRNIQRAMEESLTAVEGEGQPSHHYDSTPGARGDEDEGIDYATPTDNTYDRENEDDWFFDMPNQRKKTKDRNKYTEPPSFESVVSLEQPSSPNSYISHPPVAHQQRMLATLQNLPQPSTDRDTPTHGYHDDTPIGAQPQLLDSNEPHPSSSSDEESDSSTSSVNIDELLSKHLTNVPTIGQVGCDQQPMMMNSITLMSSDIPSVGQQFRRFDPLSRTPIHPTTKFHPLQIYSRSSQ